MTGTGDPTTLLGSTVVAQTGLYFYPYLSADGIFDGGESVASALICLGSPFSASANFGTVGAFVVDCGELFSAVFYVLDLTVCSTALYTVRQRLNPGDTLLLSAEVSVTTPDSGVLSPPYQAYAIASALYGTGVSGIVARLKLDPNATNDTDRQTTFSAVQSFSAALGSYLAQDFTFSSFNLIMLIDTSLCNAGGPLAPVGSGIQQTTLYSSCNNDYVDCRFATTFATASVDLACGASWNVTSLWAPFHGVATAPNNGAVPTPTACNNENINGAYQNLTLTSPDTLDGPNFTYGIVGAFVYPSITSDSALVSCLFSADGVGASYGVVVCDTLSSTFVTDCVGAFTALRDNASISLPLVAIIDVDADSANLTALGATVADLVNKADWGGVFALFYFGDDSSNASTNIDSILNFVRSFLEGATLSTVTKLTFGIGVSSPDVCTDPDSGPATLYIQVTTLSTRVSFILFLSIPSGNPIDTDPEDAAVCGFPRERLGYELLFSRDFNTQGCPGVTISFEAQGLTLAPTVVPTNPSRGGAVVIRASTINGAPTTGTTNLPLLTNLLTCPTLPSDDGIFDVGSQFVLVDCSAEAVNSVGANISGRLLPLSECNGALVKAASVVGSSGVPVLPPIPLLPFIVSLDANAYSYGFYATYVGGLEFSYMTGVGLGVNTVSGQVGENAAAIGSLVQGVRGLVSRSASELGFSVVIFVNGSTPNTNPCSTSGDLFGVDIVGEFAQAPNTLAYLLVNSTTLTAFSDLCQVPEPRAYGGDSVPGLFSTNNASVCSANNFLIHAAPFEYYPVSLVSVDPTTPLLPTSLLGNSVVAHTGLYFYPYLNGSRTIEYGTDLESAIECLVSNSSTSSEFGTVGALVVACGNLEQAEGIDERLTICTTALFGVQQILDSSIPVLMSCQLTTNPDVSTDLTSDIQALMAISSFYGNLIAGVVIQLDVNRSANTSTSIGANFGEIGTIAQVFSSIFFQASSSLLNNTSQFNLVLHFDPSWCDSDGPLATQGSGDNHTSVYSSCNVSSVNCLFATTIAIPAVGNTCGFPPASTVSWAPFRGVATAPHTGSSAGGQACNDLRVSGAYWPMTLGSTEPLEGDTFDFASVGGAISPLSASFSVNASCVFSEDGIGADYGVVDCNSSAVDFVERCVAGFHYLRSADSGAPLVARFSMNVSSGEFQTLAESGSEVLNKAEWGGAYVNLSFGSGSPNVTENLGFVSDFIHELVRRTQLPSGSNLTIGIGVSGPGVCQPGGALYSGDVNDTLYSRLTSENPSGVSFVLLPVVPGGGESDSELCGFDAGRVGYELLLSREFGGTCADVVLSYPGLTLRQDITPENPSGTPDGGSGSGGTGYYAFFALPGLALVICIGATSATAIIYRRQNRGRRYGHVSQPPADTLNVL